MTNQKKLELVYKWREMRDNHPIKEAMTVWRFLKIAKGLIAGKDLKKTFPFLHIEMVKLFMNNQLGR